MITKRLKVLLFLVIAAVIVVGCNSQSKTDYYETITFDGVEVSIPKEWTPLVTGEREVSYQLNVEEGEFGFFYIYAYPYQRDVYKSKFIDWEDKTYKDIYALSEEVKLKDNMTLLTYKTDLNLPESEAYPDHVIQIIVIDDIERVLEVSFDMPRDYYEQNSDVLAYIQNSIMLVS